MRKTNADMCECGDRPATGCAEPWGPGCDLGNNVLYARRAMSDAKVVPVEAIRRILERSRIPGKNYLYCLKPSEIEALLATTPPDVAAQTVILPGGCVRIAGDSEAVTQAITALRKDALAAVTVQAELAAVVAEVDRLTAMAYVPGAWTCPKCSLRIVASTLSAIDGGITSDNKPQQCANGCGAMWRVSERDERKDAYQTVEVLAERAERAEAERDALRKDARAYRSQWISEIASHIDGRSYEERIAEAEARVNTFTDEFHKATAAREGRSDG